jgi:hypothetical protein
MTTATGPGGAFNPNADPYISREMLAQLDEARTSREHWKILFISGMEFFTDAYDLFVIGVAATLVTSEWHIAAIKSHCSVRWRSLPQQPEPSPSVA